MPMSIPFEVGQIFVSADPRDEGRRLMVTALPASFGSNGWGTVGVGTLGEDGKLRRQRRVSTDQFHDSRWTQNETVRVTGYVLERAS